MVWMLNFHVLINEGYCIGCLQVSSAGIGFCVKHSTLESIAILMKDSVAIFLASGPNPNWLDSVLNLGIF